MGIGGGGWWDFFFWGGGMRKKNGFKGVGGGQPKTNEGKGGQIKLGWKRFSTDEKVFWFIHEILT